MKLHRVRQANSQLVGRRYRLLADFEVRVDVPQFATLQSIDDQWANERETDDLAKDWKWASVVRDKDVFVVRGREDDVVSIWRSTKSTITLADLRVYRLDNLEVRPRARKSGLGRFTVALACWRAVECKAARLVLAAPPERVPFYLELGAEDARQLKWKGAAGLIALQFASEAILKLKELVDALEIKNRS